MDDGRWNHEPWKISGSGKSEWRLIAVPEAPSGSSGTYPKFQLYLDATKWATVTVQDGSTVYVKEMIIRAPSNAIDVCLCCATTGSPFISTLELRPLNLSMYATDFEDDFYLKVAARINFGAPSTEAVRYPDDPYDRIWDSDLEKRQNYLVGVASGTERINTTKNINVNTREYPPVKVMQTAVVGTKGMLTYRLDLEDFPANARAYAYFAEIEELGVNETRKFKMQEPYMPDYSNAVVNIAENANGSYTLYEPSYMNVTLEFVLSFSFVKTRDSTRGPLLNAIEISKYVQVASNTNAQDVNVLHALLSMSAESFQANEGDPCLPTHWEWVNCSYTTPPRITRMGYNFHLVTTWLKPLKSSAIPSCVFEVEIMLSGKNVQGEIPSEIKNMDALTELWLDGNSLNGSIPDMSSLINLKIVYVQNNSLMGEIPPELLAGNVTFNYKGNPGLTQKQKHKIHYKLIVSISVGVLAILSLLLIGSLLLLCNIQKKHSYHRSDDKGDSFRISTKPSSAYSVARGGHLMDEGVAIYIPLPEIEEATENFSRNIGKGSFGPVYYGKMKDGKEVAVKIMADPTSHGTKQFVTELPKGFHVLVQARSLIRKGDVNSIIDPSLAGTVKIESLWRVAEVAIQCVEKHGSSRPRMQEIILAIQDAIKIQKGSEKISTESSRAQSGRKTLLASFLDVESPDLSNGCLNPSAR
ncbi:unnamed protein product [Thlaspi arvense]|uniref:Malectin-like domain-containing protein n=1 Tax=Thlaspi arvense TaxID=13288 RepID=A0AAU9RJL6_THLAR|nr:unnamed protein product [Thlaspi arvense]